MRYIKISRLLLILFLIPSFFFVAARPGDAAACISSPVDYTLVTTNSKYKLVYLAPYSNLSNSIRQSYSKSGLYDVNNPGRMLWSFDDSYNRWHDDSSALLYATEDGKYLVKRSGILRADGLSFYKEGELLKNYNVDFFEAKWPADSMSCFNNWFVKSEFERLDEAAGRFYLTAPNQKTYIFDIYSGDFLGFQELFNEPELLYTSPNEISPWLIVAGGTLVWFVVGGGLLTGWWLKKRFRKRS